MGFVGVALLFREGFRNFYQEEYREVACILLVRLGTYCIMTVWIRDSYMSGKIQQKGI